MKEEIRIFKNKKIEIILKKREKPIPEFEQLAKAVDNLKIEISKTWFGKFMLWILDRLSRWIRNNG